MSKAAKKPAKDKEPAKKEEEAVPREKVKLSDNLPKVPIRKRVDDIVHITSENEFIMEKYIPEEKKIKYKKNFDLFDRNYDQRLIYEEVKEFLISIGQMIPEEDLKEFYKFLV